YNIQVTDANSPTTINTKGGADTINIGSRAPTMTGGIVDHIKGGLTIVGGGADTLNVDDTGSTSAKTGTLTFTEINGLGVGPSGITYSGLSALNLNLGSGGDTFTIQSTSTATTNLNSGSGNDVVNVQATTGTTKVNTGGGTNTINVGSLAPMSGGIVDKIQGALTIVGSGADTLN